MKTSKPILIFIISALLFYACSENNDIKIEKYELTQCEKNIECTLKFYDKADMKNLFTIIEGQYRVFSLSKVKDIGSCDIEDRLMIKAPLDSELFSLNKKDIQDGKIVYHSSCACCNLVTLIPIDGSVKGVQGEDGKWLLDLNVILGTVDKVPFDTIIVKQYFTKASIPN